MTFKHSQFYLMIMFLIAAPFALAGGSKVCSYTHEESELVNGVLVTTIPLHTYSTYRVGLNEDCGSTPLPANHEWANLTKVKEGTRDVTYFGTSTIDNEECKIRRTTLIIHPNVQ